MHGRNTTRRYSTVSMAAVFAIVGVTWVASPIRARSADPTFAEDVAPIVYRNCAVCHHPGGMGPFSVINYDTAAAHAGEIRDAVAARVMPPWHSTDPHGSFSNDRRLSDDDRNTILRWIDAGAKPGDLNKLPPKPEYAGGWAIGTPDLVVSMLEDYPIPASGTVDYQYFQMPVNIPEDKWVEAIEIMPSDREVVHHVLAYAAAPLAAPAANPAPVTPGSTPAPAPPLLIRNKDQSQPPSEPRRDTAHAQPKRMGSLVGTYVPGTNVIRFPAGTAMRLRPGTVMTFQMHYTAHGHATHDRTAIGFRFAKEPPAEEIFASEFVNGQFTIPPGAKDVAVPAEIGFGRPVRVWGLMPHTHLRGTRWLYKLELPDSSSRVVLDVPHYDFNWQTYYMFAKPLEIPVGGKITSTAWYDNSPTNKHNPDPSTEVRWGAQTWEEMQYTGFMYSVVSRKTTP